MLSLSLLLAKYLLFLLVRLPQIILYVLLLIYLWCAHYFSLSLLDVIVTNVTQRLATQDQSLVRCPFASHVEVSFVSTVLSTQ